MLNLMVAITFDGVMGKDNKLAWRIPTDLKYFKEKTLGKKMIMGRKTFESLGGVLPNREHIVLTRDTSYKAPESVKIIHTLEEVEPYIDSEEEVFLIGGAEIFTMFMDKCHRLYITWVDKEFEGDTYFPLLKLKDYKEVSSVEAHDEKSDIHLIFSVYEKLENPIS